MTKLNHAKVSIEQKREYLKEHGWYQLRSDDNWLQHNYVYKNPDTSGTPTERAYEIAKARLKKQKPIKLRKSPLYGEDGKPLNVNFAIKVKLPSDEDLVKIAGAYGHQLHTEGTGVDLMYLQMDAYLKGMRELKQYLIENKK